MVPNSQHELPLLPPLPLSVSAGRVPEWDFDDLILRKCPVCSGLNKMDICKRPDRLIVSRCLECGMLYLPAIPSEVQLKNFYASYAEYKKYYPPSFLSKMQILATKNPYINILQLTGGLRGQNICEVGCSYGQFLTQCSRLGASVMGVEWDINAINYLARNGIVTTFELPINANLDVICAFQVIEHLEDPDTMISNASSSLVRDGRLLLFFPNGGECDEMGSSWLGFRVDLEHLNYFSLSSISNLLQKHGLYVEHYWEYGQPGVSRQKSQSTSSKIVTKLMSMICNENAPKFTDGKFILGILARKN